MLFKKVKYDDNEEENNSKKVNTIQELKQMITFKPFVILCLGTFLNTFGIQVLIIIYLPKLFFFKILINIYKRSYKIIYSFISNMVTVQLKVYLCMLF